MRILLLGHREIASNLGISLLVQGLQQFDLRIALSGTGEEAHSDHGPELAELNKVEQAMCDVLDEGLPGSEAARVGLFGFKDLARQTGKPVEMLSRPNSPEGLAKLRSWAPDLILSLRYRKILYDEAIAQPRLGVLNLHSGLLPDFRGVMATFHAMLAGSGEIGSTLHLITDSGIDTGPIIAVCPIDADYEATYLDNVFRLYPTGCARMVAAVNDLATGKQLIRNEKSGPGTYFSTPTPGLCTKFRQVGLRLCDGNELERHISRLL